MNSHCHKTNKNNTFLIKQQSMANKVLYIMKRVYIRHGNIFVCFVDLKSSFTWGLLNLPPASRQKTFLYTCIV